MMKRNKKFDSTWLSQYECGKKEVGIFELAELLGVTSEAIRKYENKDIIQEIDDKEYRQWYIVSLDMLCIKR